MSTCDTNWTAYLRLHGVNAKDHPVFRELTRVKQYFEKIKSLETEPEQRTMRLDKEAAGRFIKHGLVLPPSPTQDFRNNTNRHRPVTRN